VHGSRYHRPIEITDVKGAGTSPPFPQTSENAPPVSVYEKLRGYFREDQVIDPTLRASSRVEIGNFFRKCSFYSPEQHNHLRKGDFRKCGVIDNDDENGKGEAIRGKCMVWVEKGSKNRVNDNLYFWFSSSADPKRKRNVRVKLLMFEWFVGPARLTRGEVEASKGKGKKSRVRPRQLRNTCGNRFCINPFHLKCIPDLPKDIPWAPRVRNVHESAERPARNKKRRIYLLNSTTCSAELMVETRTREAETKMLQQAQRNTTYLLDSMLF
jgi:hypothetical protein